MASSAASSSSATTSTSTRIEADFEGGVLRLTVPVAEKAKPRKIQVGGQERDRHRGLTERGTSSRGGADIAAVPARATLPTLRGFEAQA